MMKKLHKNIRVFIALLAVAATVDGQNDGEKAEVECVKFDEKRFKLLNEVAKNGDLRCKDTLKPAEYETMTNPNCHTNFSPEIIEEFVKIEKSLGEKQKSFLNQHQEVRDAANKGELDQFLKTVEVALEGQGGEATEKYGTFVLLSKKLLMNIFSAEGEAARLDVFAFMKLKKWKALAFAFEMSKIQSVALDQLTNEDIWQEHLANWHPQQMEAIGMRRVVIGGAGPNGLLTAFKLLSSGMDIALVNDRVEYTRPQMSIYDSNWMFIFRYLLGTQFSQIFHSPGVVQEERGFIGLRYVENALRKRLEELAEFMDKKKKSSNGVAVGGTLNIHYGFSVIGLDEGSDGDQKFHAKLRDERDGSIKLIPADLFLCMGGSNDQLRGPLLDSKPVQHSGPVNYTSGIFKKVQNSGNIYLDVVPTNFKVEIESMGAHLEKANFDALIKKSRNLLPKSVQRRFTNFTQKLLKSKDTTYFFVLIENWEYFSVATKTPMPIVRLLAEIEAQIQGEHKEIRKKELEQFGRRIRWKWCAAAFNYAFYAKIQKDAPPSEEQLSVVNIDENGDAMEHKSAAFSVDIDPVGTRTFDVAVRTMANAVLERKSPTGGSSVVVAALGDALANTHFFSGSGMSVGRKGSEFLVKSIKEVISGIANKRDFAMKLADGLKKVAEDAVKLLMKFVPDELKKSTTTAEVSHPAEGIQTGKKRKAAMSTGEEQTQRNQRHHQMKLRNRG